MTQTATNDALRHQAEAALALLTRYQDLDPVVACAGFGLRPAAEAYLRQATPAGRRPSLAAAPPGLSEVSQRAAGPGFSQAPDAARQAAHSHILRARIDLWRSLLAQDIPGYLAADCAGRRARRTAALQQRALRMIALVEARAAAGRPLPYGPALIADLHAAVAARPPAAALVAGHLRSQLATLHRILTLLLGAGHADLAALSAPASVRSSAHAAQPTGPAGAAAMRRAG